MATRFYEDLVDSLGFGSVRVMGKSPYVAQYRLYLGFFGGYLLLLAANAAFASGTGAWAVDASEFGVAFALGAVFAGISWLTNAHRSFGRAIVICVAFLATALPIALFAGLGLACQFGHDCV